MKKHQHKSYRKRRIYGTAFRVIRSYCWLFVLSKIRGKRFVADRMHEFHLRNAKRVHGTIIELKGLLVKLGQMLSGFSNALPEQYQHLLEDLQDHAPAKSRDEISTTLQETFGKTPEELFAEFSWEPLASASIGQVHEAVLLSGERVVVKVQHREIERLAKTDLEIIEGLINWLSRLFKIKGLPYVFDQVEQMVLDELDYEHEARVMQFIDKNLEDVSFVKIPHVYEQFSQKKVLTLSYEEGCKISNIKQLDAWGIDREQLTKNLIQLFGKMIFEDGFYHADPHPGNLLVRPDGTIVLLDFGATAVLSSDMKQAIPPLVIAILQKDNEGVIQALQQMGFMSTSEEAEETVALIIETLSHFLQHEVKMENLNFKDIRLEDIQGSSLNKLFDNLSFKQLTQTFQVPKDWILLERTVLFILGLSSTLAPEVNVIKEVKPIFKRLVFRNTDFKSLILDAVKQQITTALSLPKDLSKFLKAAQKKGISIQNKEQEKQVRLLYGLGQQFIFTCSSIALFYFANQEQHSSSTRNVLYTCASLCIVLVLKSMWKHRK